VKAESTSRKWRAFSIPDLFDTLPGNQSNMTALPDGTEPLVSARKFNNGYKGFVRASSQHAISGHCITLNNDGDGGAGLAFYQPHSMFLDTHVTALIPKQKTEYHALIFIARCLSNQHKLYGNGHSINEARLKRFTFMLPTTPDGAPDYSFMEETMREKERTILARYAERAKFIFAEPRCEPTRWKEFPLTDIFEISPGVRLTKADMKPGRTPFAGASDSNNGITAFVSNRNESLDRDVLGVNYNGSVGESFYHPYETVFSDDVKRLRVKGHPGGRHVYLFLKVAILKQAAKYQYGYKFNEEHMRRQSLFLPSTLDGAPDFAGMEAFMRHKEAEQIARYAGIRLQDHITKCAVS